MRPFLKGRVALVTGASQGLGAGTAKVLARAGASVILTARNRGALDQLVAEITAEGAHAVAIPADLSKDSDVATLVAQAMEAAGRIDFLLNIGGSAEGIGSKLWDVSAETWAGLTATNITGALNLIRHVVPVMQAQHSGRLYFLSSPATFRPWAETGAYAATKAAVNQMVRTLALELKDSGVTANVFNPGPISTQVFDTVSEVLDRTGDQPRAGQPEAQQAAKRPAEAAALLLLWLCAPENAELNGEFIQWNHPNTVSAMEEFLQAQQIGAFA